MINIVYEGIIDMYMFVKRRASRWNFSLAIMNSS